MAKVIRYGRAVYADGRIKQADVLEALKIKVGIVVGGGYPARGRRLSERQPQEIFERDGGKCCLCGDAATEIDHIGSAIDGDINHPDNLQALCNECHRKKTLSRFRPIETEEERQRSLEIQLRIQAPEPLRPCDAADWQHRWRTVKKERLDHARP
jgi:HNH endonuclease